MIEYHTLTKNENFTDLLDLSREFFGEYEAYHEVFFLIDELTDEDITGYFSSFCDRDTRRAIIAVENNKIIGYITVYVKDQADYWKIKRVGEISGLMVQKEYRRRGVAEQLMKEARKFFESSGVKYYLVYTSTENRTGLEFYEHFGLNPLYKTMIGEV